MRLVEHMKQTVTAKPAAASAKYQENERLYRFDEEQAFAVRAVLQPLTEQPDTFVYGETQAAKLLMLYDGDETLDEGMGVCVDVSPSAPCDYRISEMPRRYQSHKELTLAFIPEEQRG
jgi:hypothetical protein